LPDNFPILFKNIIDKFLINVTRITQAVYLCDIDNTLYDMKLDNKCGDN